MFDKNLLFSDAVVVNANGDSAVLDIYKTPAKGVRVGLIVTAVSGALPTLDAIVKESDDGATWYNVVSFKQISGIGAQYRLVQSKMKKLKISYTVGGTGPSFTVTAGPASEASRDATA